MRNLGNEDIFAIGRILSKANLKEEIKKVAIGNEKDVEALGFDLLFTILISCSDRAVEAEIYEFLSSIFEMEVEEVKKLDPIKTFEMIKEVADWGKWKSFFSLAAKSTK